MPEFIVAVVDGHPNRVYLVSEDVRAATDCNVPTLQFGTSQFCTQGLVCDKFSGHGCFTWWPMVAMLSDAYSDSD